MEKNKKQLVLYWARRDLRLHDNRALTGAMAECNETKSPLLPIYILEEYMIRAHGGPEFGYPQQYILAHALPLFARHLPHMQLVRGVVESVFAQLARHYALTIHVNEDIYHDFFRQIDALRTLGIRVKVYADRLTVAKDTKTGAGNLYSIFTPFKNAVWSSFITARPLSAPHLHTGLHLSDEDVSCLHTRLRLLTIDTASIMAQFTQKRTLSLAGHTYDLRTLIDVPHTYTDWYMDEVGAHEMARAFMRTSLMHYKKKRDSLSLDAHGGGSVSRLSLALAWGFISARTLVAMAQEESESDLAHPYTTERLEGPVHFISELLWREFYAYLLYHRPALMHEEFQEKFRGRVVWAEESLAHTRFRAWIQGRTGYPVVDAAMMQLARTGYMHNRARMVAASILTKNLGVDWRWGQAYFRATLIDLDEASNNGGWQWGASVGADPKPIRIFNPHLQADNYDADNAYQNKWLSPEHLAHPPAELVSHKEAREDALRRYGLTSVTPRDY